MGERKLMFVEGKIFLSFVCMIFEQDACIVLYCGYGMKVGRKWKSNSTYSRCDKAWKINLHIGF